MATKRSIGNKNVFLTLYPLQGDFYAIFIR